MTLFLNLTDKLNAVILYVLACLLAVVSVAVIAQVSVRFVLTAAGINLSAPWTEELARYGLIWMVFLGAGYGMRHSRMISMEFLIQSLPPQIGIPLRYLVLAMIIGFSGLLLKAGLDFVALGRSETSPVLGITKDWVYWAMPVGAALLILNTLAHIADNLIAQGDIRQSAASSQQD
ncbi:MAG: TRAP transporter small permease [Roseinatronobacter sp.]